MSRWDNFYRYKLHKHSMDYTFFFPSSATRLGKMLCSGMKDMWNDQDLFDLSCFIESFVLYEKIGLPTNFADYIGPYIIDFYPNDEDIPIFDYHYYLKKIWPQIDLKEFSDEKIFHNDFLSLLNEPKQSLRNDKATLKNKSLMINSQYRKTHPEKG